MHVVVALLCAPCKIETHVNLQGCSVSLFGNTGAQYRPTASQQLRLLSSTLAGDNACVLWVAGSRQVVAGARQAVKSASACGISHAWQPWKPCSAQHCKACCSHNSPLRLVHSAHNAYHLFSASFPVAICATALPLPPRNPSPLPGHPPSLEPSGRASLGAGRRCRSGGTGGVQPVPRTAQHPPCCSQRSGQHCPDCRDGTGAGQVPCECNGGSAGHQPPDALRGCVAVLQLHAWFVLCCLSWLIVDASTRRAESSTGWSCRAWQFLCRQLTGMPLVIRHRLCYCFDHIADLLPNGLLMCQAYALTQCRNGCAGM